MPFSIDWTLRENVQAQLHVLVKRNLRKYGYPPDKQEQGTKTVLEEAIVLCPEWLKPLLQKRKSLGRPARTTGISRCEPTQWIVVPPESVAAFCGC